MNQLQEYKSQQTSFLKQRVYWSTRAAVTKFHRLELKQQTFIFSQFWKLDVWGQVLARLFFGKASLYDYLLEGLLLKLKLQYFGHLWFTGKYPNAGKGWRQKEEGSAEDEMVSL